MASDDYRQFESLFHATNAELFAYIYRRTLNREDAEDILQTTFTFAWMHLSELPADFSIRPWLFRIAHRTMSNHWRSAGRRRKLWFRVAEGMKGERKEASDDPQSIYGGVDYALVLRAIRKLRRSDQEILFLAYWDKLPHAEAAYVLGCSANAFNIRLHRARLSLEQTYAEILRNDSLEPNAAKETPQCGQSDSSFGGGSD